MKEVTNEYDKEKKSDEGIVENNNIKMHNSLIADVNRSLNLKISNARLIRVHTCTQNNFMNEQRNLFRNCIFSTLINTLC